VIVRIVLLLVVLLVAGCGNMFSSDEVQSTLTERQRDSVLARSALPGSGTVGRALEHSDRAARRSADIDSIIAR